MPSWRHSYRSRPARLGDSGSTRWTAECSLVAAYRLRSAGGITSYGGTTTAARRTRAGSYRSARRGRRASRVTGSDAIRGSLMVDTSGTGPTTLTDPYPSVDG